MCSIPKQYSICIWERSVSVCIDLRSPFDLQSYVFGYFDSLLCVLLLKRVGGWKLALSLCCCSFLPPSLLKFASYTLVLCHWMYMDLHLLFLPDELTIVLLYDTLLCPFWQILTFHTTVSFTYALNSWDRVAWFAILSESPISMGEIPSQTCHRYASPIF